MSEAQQKIKQLKADFKSALGDEDFKKLLLKAYDAGFKRGVSVTKQRYK